MNLEQEHHRPVPDGQPIAGHVRFPRHYAFLHEPFDRRDPDPWLTIYMDNSVPVDPDVKAAWMADSRRVCRQFVLPFLRPIARLVIVLVQIVRAVVPNRFTSSKYLHKFLAWSLKHFATPEANWLILRHFWIGTENLAFLRQNIKGVVGEPHPLTPANTDDLVDHLFLQHDINLFNLIADIQMGLKAQGTEQIERAFETLDYSMITDGHFAIDPQPDRWTNVFDLQTCIDLFTPIYQIFLSDSDFWRSVQSLQLDETIAIYAARLVGNPEGLALVNNKHPMVVPATITAGYRLVLHGLSAEMLHKILRDKKRQQQANGGRDIRTPVL